MGTVAPPALNSTRRPSSGLCSSTRAQSPSPAAASSPRTPSPLPQTRHERHVPYDARPCNESNYEVRILSLLDPDNARDHPPPLSLTYCHKRIKV